MSADLHYLAASTALTIVMLLGASLIRVRGWTLEGTLLAMQNRDNLPEPTPLSARADRAARNMLEGMVCFVAALLVARLGGGDSSGIAQGAAVFFWARVAYWPVYLVGIPCLRTLIWGISIWGIATLLLTVY
jgi:uncharacterized MAPEG superfamily protein